MPVLDFDSILKASTKAVEEVYFKAPWVGSAPRYRERVYCYELYHQLRTRLVETEYVLHGEMDKSGHSYFGASRAPKPDFIIHKAGTHDNFAVVEVKRVESIRSDTIRKDLRTLEALTGRYQRLIYLVFGEQDTRKTFQRISKQQPATSRAPEVWLHAQCGCEAVKQVADSQ